jgi:hypothetical protein
MAVVVCDHQIIDTCHVRKGRVCRSVSVGLSDEKHGTGPTAHAHVAMRGPAANTEQDAECRGQ